MTRRITRLVLLAGFWAMTAVAGEVTVPPGLQGWEGWVLHGAEHRRCPFLFAQDPSQEASYRCAWPGRLQLNVDARGGRFSQRWQVFADSWVALPGNLETWPRDVRANNTAAAVVERDGRPQLRLVAGDYQISGRFEWSVRPESLDIAAQSGLIDLSVDGRKIAQPERPGGAVALGRAAQAEQATALEVQVYRLLIDDIPARLDTQIKLQVAGDAREEVLARVLPEGFTATSLGGDLPARLDADGRLRVQVRPGSHILSLSARAASVATTLRRPQRAANSGAWPGIEIWSFAGIDRLRVASASGAQSVDPVQVEVPESWRQLPAFRMDADSQLKIEETQRGLSSADENRLTLNRQLWLDFDHGGYTALDTVSGKMRQGWRLDMAAPYRLESARSGGQNLLVSLSPGSERRGVEIRAPQLQLQTLSRLEGRAGAQPATGWVSRFENVSGQLNLPPGHLLLAALGPDEASGTWWSGWGLWSIFCVIIVVFLTYRVAGLAPALLALGGLVLLYQEWPLMLWLWANVLIAISLGAVVPAGKLRRFVHGYRLLAALVLALALLPFLWTQIRYALYPQLTTAGFGVMDVGAVMPGTTAAPEEIVVTAAKRAGNAAAEAVGESAVMEDKMRESMDAAPPPPASQPVEMDEPRRARVDVLAAARANSQGLNNSQVVQRYAAGTALQTGPGIPGWRYLRYGYSWSGPVEATDTVRFLIIGPLLFALWRIAGVLMLALWLVSLVQHGWQFKLRLPASVLLLLALGALPGSDARAETPGSELLTELGNRLKAQPACFPSCATLTAANINVNGERLVVELEGSALANVAVPVPSAQDRWQIDSVSVDGGAGYTVLRESDGSLWVPLRAGAHRIRLEGRIAPVTNLQLGFPSVPRAVRVSAVGWDVAGVTEGRMLSSAIELTRQRTAVTGGKQGTALERGAEFPAFVRVTRDFSLDLDWSVATTVQRLAPERASIAVEVPLVAGESVLTPGIEVRGGKTVLAGIPAGAAATRWQSGLARSASLELMMPAAVARVEVWTFSINPQWHAEFNGLPAVLPDDVNAPNWLYTYYPRAGETLAVKLTRPAGAPGGTLAIDSARQWIRYSARSSDAGLDFQYRSTQGGRHVIDLPEDAVVEQVSIDGQPQQIRPEQGKLSIGLLPGEHKVEIRWRVPRGAGFRSGTEPVNLNANASNVSSSIEMPQDRWTLLALAGGAGVGPAVLYWGELVAFLVTAWALGRWRRSPLRPYEWFLLGIGLSTLSAAVFATVVVWVLAMSWRASWQPDVSRWRFNLVQSILALATVIAVSSLVFSGIRYGLFSTPDMGVTGPGSYAGNFAWFRDRTVAALPRPEVISVPLWTYKTLIIVWALWVVAALVRWLKWAWQSWSAGGYWRSREPA